MFFHCKVSVNIGNITTKTSALQCYHIILHVYSVYTVFHVDLPFCVPEKKQEFGLNSNAGLFQSPNSEVFFKLFSRDEEKCLSRNEDLTRFASILMFYCQHFLWLQTYESLAVSSHDHCV